jgi:diguanylate cyclase (GGDEF)-like protein
VFLSAWRRTRFNVRTQAFWLFIGCIWPGIVNLIYMFNKSPLKLDLTPFALSASAVCFYIALFRYEFLEFREMIMDVAFSEINEGILVLDNQDRLVDFNKACQRIFPWADSSHVGGDIARFKEGQTLLASSGDVFEMQLSRDGLEKSYEFRQTRLRENQRQIGRVYIIQDISSQKLMIKELRNLSNLDSLTQIYNRRRLLEEVSKEIKRAQRYKHPVSILMIDINLFKSINDHYGHLAGDEVLKTIATACQSRLRATDILGRFGGEEFIILLPETGQTSAGKVAEAIRQHVASLTIVYDDQPIQVTVSIGVNTASEIDEKVSEDQLIDLADQAMYQAKKAGRNQVVISGQ